VKLPVLAIAAAGGVLLSLGQAEAAGCNGHVNVAEWGCAPWDNNNGPQFPHYVAPAKPAPAHVAPAPPLVKAAPPKIVAPSHPGPANGLLSTNGGNAAGGKIISDNSEGLIGKIR